MPSLEYSAHGFTPGLGSSLAGTHDLKVSWQTLSIKILGANPKAKKGYRVGVDYLRMIPAR